MARVVAQAAAGVELEDVLVSPIKSIPKALKKAGLSLADMDLFEINEAFSATTLAVMKGSRDRQRQSKRPWRRRCLGSSHRRKRSKDSDHNALRLERKGIKERHRFPLPGRR